LLEKLMARFPGSVHGVVVQMTTLAAANLVGTTGLAACEINSPLLRSATVPARTFGRTGNFTHTVSLV
jgi:hypothetical protein